MKILDHLSQETPLARYGYQIIAHNNPQNFLQLKEKFEHILCVRLEKFGASLLSGFTAEKYHSFIATNDLDHHAFIRKNGRGLPQEILQDIYILDLVASASALIGKTLRIYRNSIEFRVCRPQEADNNPWHRDHWFPYFDPLLNVYLPISSSFVDSSLQVIPFSHTWTEEECVPTFHYDPDRQQKTNKEGIRYSVPEIKECTKPLIGHRFDIIPGNFALFSPKSVHGNGSNNSLGTRFSFEFRLEVV